MKPIKPNFIDKAVQVFSPQAYINRLKNRAHISALEENGYITPGSSRKIMKGWGPSANSPAGDTRSKLSPVRAGTRDLYMNTPLTGAIIGRIDNNVVGSGLIPQLNPDHETLGITPEKANKIAQQIESRFDAWAQSKNSDFTGLHNFYDNTSIALVSTLLNGDLGFSLPWRAPLQSNWPWELTLKMVEADLIRNPGDVVSPSKDIDNGIEFKDGRMVAVHIAPYYKGFITFDEYKSRSLKWERIPIFDEETGRQNFYLLNMPGFRIGQRRAMSVLAPVLEKLKTLTKLSEAYLAGELVSALFTVFVKDMSGMGGTLNAGFTPEESALGGGTAVDEEGNQTSYRNGEGNELDLEMGHGNIVYLDENKEIQFANPKRDPASFEPYYMACAKEIAANLGLPAEEVLLMFGDSYSASRAALLQAWKMYRKRRIWLARNFCQPILEAFIEEEVIKGRIKAKGFLEDPVMRAAWSRCLWVGPGNGQLNPKDEADAAVTKIANNLSTHEEEYLSDKGGRWDSAMARKKLELDLLRKNNLISEDNSPTVNPGGTGIE